MATVEYRCVSCGGVHEMSVRPGGGAMYLRCIVTREWAWHDPAQFLQRAPAGRGAAAGASSRVRAAGGRRGPSKARAAVRRKAAPRKARARRAPVKRVARTKRRGR